MGYILNLDFWDSEKKCNLFIKNYSFVTQDNASELCEKFLELVNLIPENKRKDIKKKLDESKIDKLNKEIERLFYHDSERTFCSKFYRDLHTLLLRKVYNIINDYHQGTGLMCGFLSLFLPHDLAATVIIYLNETVLRDFLKAENQAYLTECMVFDMLLQHHDQELYDHLSYSLVSGQFLSKWWIGQCIHVFPIEYIIKWFEVLIKNSERETLQEFAFAFMKVNRKIIMKSADPSHLTSILRLDSKLFDDDSRDYNGKILYQAILDEINSQSHVRDNYKSFKIKAEIKINEINQILEKQKAEYSSIEYSDSEYVSDSDSSTHLSGK